MTLQLDNVKTAVVGLGYVGMPLAVMLAKSGTVIGYDQSEQRIAELAEGRDSNREIDEELLKQTSCTFTADPQDIADCNLYIITVPTPVDENNQPDLTIVKNASKSIGKYLTEGDVVVYESTVYPGVTEDICGPILEQESGFKSGREFFLGYSPERINPGDDEHTLSKITKVVAGQTPEVTEFLATFYGQVNAGNIFKAKDIKTAEASKVIENAQRDINVAFINEITMVLNKLGLSSADVLEAAGTKWNFLPFTPGLVGGHCIGVDPYYLAQCARDLGHDPEVILAGRKINDQMGAYVAGCLDALCDGPSKILIMGFTFKENINDIRNTKVIDVVRTLEELGHNVDVHDPHAIPDEVVEEYGVPILSDLPEGENYDAIGLCTAHNAYKEMSAEAITALLKGSVIYDIKGIWRHLEFPANFTYKCL